MKANLCALGTSVLLISFLTSCGGGGSSTTQPHPSPSSFTLSVSPTTSQGSPLGILMGSAGGSITVGVNAQNGFSGNVTLSLSGLPAGVAATPSNPTVIAGQSQQITLAADANAPVGTFQANISGVSGATTGSVALFGRVDLPPDSAVVGPLGGTVVGSSTTIGGVQLIIPPNALSRNTLIQMKAVPQASFPPSSPEIFFTGLAVQLLPSGLQFSAPALLSLPLPDADQDGVLDVSNIPTKDIEVISVEDATPVASVEECDADLARQALVCDVLGFSSFFQAYHRFASGRIVTYCFGTLPSNSDGTDLATGITSALDEWTKETRRSGISFTLVSDCASADINFGSKDYPAFLCNFIYAKAGWAVFGLCPNGTCIVTFNNHPCGITVQGAIALKWTADQTNTNGTIQIFDTAIHEVGHVLGLFHVCGDQCPASSCPAMNPDEMNKHYNPFCPLLQLGKGDVAAYRHHYGLVYAESGQGINLPPSTLYTVDPVPNGADVQVGSGPIALPDSSTPVITDVAQSSTGQLFAISFDNLYSIDILTAQAQLVGPLGRSGFNALAFDRQGNLFAASAAGDWARVNIQTGAAQILGSFGSGFVASGDIVFVPTFPFLGGTPYGTARTVSNVNDQLVKIDATSGQANLIMDLGTSNVFGFSWVAPGTSGVWIPCLTTTQLLCTNKFFALTTDPTDGMGSLYLVDTGAGTAQFIRTLSFNAFGASGAQRRKSP